MTTHTLITAALLLGSLSVLGGFILGWIARAEQNHTYAQSRHRHHRHLAELGELAERELGGQSRPRWDAQRDVVYVPVPVPTPVVVPVAVAGLGWAQPVGTGTPIVPGQPALPPVPPPEED